MSINNRYLMMTILILVVWSSAQAQDDEVIKIDTNLVTVNVSVTDAKNRHLPGLKAEDFLVTDQGQRVRPEFFDSQGPVSIVFVVDISSSMRAKWNNLRTGLKRFLSKGHEASRKERMCRLLPRGGYVFLGKDRPVYPEDCGESSLRGEQRDLDCHCRYP